MVLECMLVLQYVTACVLSQVYVRWIYVLASRGMSAVMVVRAWRSKPRTEASIRGVSPG
jgi:hypothetical protein